MDEDENDNRLRALPQKEKDEILFEAMTEPDPDGVTFMISAGANVNARDSQGRTPLMFARHSGFAKPLIERGADVNAKDKYGDTPIVYAYRLSVTLGAPWGSELTDYLLSVGASKQELAHVEQIHEKLDEASEKLKKFKLGGKRKTKRRARKSKKRKLLK